MTHCAFRNGSPIPRGYSQPELVALGALAAVTASGSAGPTESTNNNNCNNPRTNPAEKSCQ